MVGIYFPFFIFKNKKNRSGKNSYTKNTTLSYIFLKGKKKKIQISKMQMVKMRDLLRGI